MVAKWGPYGQSALALLTGVAWASTWAVRSPASSGHSSAPPRTDQIASTKQLQLLLYRADIRLLPAMANPIQAVPKFLLPRLSWSAPVGQYFARASVATTQAGSFQRPWQPMPRTLHTERSSPRSFTTGSAQSFSSPLQQPVLRRAFHASAPRRRDHHFDTLKFVQRLQSEGFTEDQSVAIMKVLNDVIQERSAQSSSSASP